MKRACIFCASSPKIDDSYIRDAKDLTRLLVNAGWGIVYGGGSIGLMGAIADETLALNGCITGVIPHFMVEVEWANKNVEDMRETVTMSERKRLMLDLSDSIIALPGSTGTMDEFFEAMADKKLGLHTKPLVLLNTNGFFDHTVAQLKRMVADGFMNQRHMDVMTVANTPAEVLEAINKIEENPIQLKDGAV